MCNKRTLILVTSMNTAGSVSKGIFAFKGHKRTLEDETGCSQSERWRKRVGEQQLELLTQVTETFITAQSQSMLLDLVKYVRECQEDLKHVNSQFRHLKEVPTAALIKGVNMPDHTVLFATLQKLLVEEVTSHVIHLQSSDGLNTKSAIGAIARQLINTCQAIDDGDDETDDPVVTSWSTSRVSATVDTILAWHAAQPQSASGVPLLVLIIEDFEAFFATVLSDLVTIFSGHVDHMPVVFVFGLATSAKVLTGTFPNRVMRLLDITCFQLPSSSNMLDELIQRTLMSDDVPFKVGHRAFSLLLDNFLCHNFSAAGFITSLKFCLLDHFYDNPASILCQPMAEARKIIAKLTSDDLQCLCRLPSVRQYVAKQTNYVQGKNSDSYLKSLIEQMLVDLHSYVCNFFIAVRCLHSCTSQLPNCPLGKQLREVLSACLASNVVETHSYKHALELLRCLSRDNMQAMLERCVEVCDSLLDVKEQLLAYKKSLSTLEEDAAAAGDEDDSEALVYKSRAERIMSRHRATPQSKKITWLYESLRSKTVDYLHSLFIKHLRSPKNVPLNEALFYHGGADLQHRLCGGHRNTLQLALAKPHAYMTEMDDCLEPDVCVAYRLHLECGRLINLQDWMQAFTVLVTTHAEMPPKKKKKENSAETQAKVLQARFVRAVAELQFLGFIKSTKRKTDHVQRLTWGGC